MKKYSLIISFSIAFLMLFTFLSCGVVKKDKNKTEEATKTEIEDKSKNDKSEIGESQNDINIKKWQESTISDQDQTESIKEVIEPLDPTKEASYTDASGQKQILNNAKKTTETKKEKNNKKTESATKTDTSEKLIKKSAKKELAVFVSMAKSAAKNAAEDIHVERKYFSAWNLLWLLIPIGIYFIWKNKTKIIGYLSGIY